MEVDTQTNDKTYNLTVKGQNDRNIEIHIATKLTLGDLLQRIDDLTKDKESWTHYTVGNTRLILNGASMENALITDRYNMTTTLDEIIGLTDGSVLTLAQGQPNRNRSVHANVDSPAYSNLAQFKTLVRNVKACNSHAQRDQEPNSRPRYDQPENIESLPPQPSKFHLSFGLVTVTVLPGKTVTNFISSGEKPPRSSGRIFKRTFEIVTYSWRPGRKLEK